MYLVTEETSKDSADSLFVCEACLDDDMNIVDELVDVVCDECGYDSALNEMP